MVASIVDRHWEKQQLATVPTPFITTVVAALGAPQMLRGAGAGELRRAGAAWVGACAAARGERCARWELVLALLGLLLREGDWAEGQQQEQPGEQQQGKQQQQPHQLLLRTLVQSVVNAAVAAAEALAEAPALVATAAGGADGVRAVAGAGQEQRGGAEDAEEEEQQQVVLLDMLRNVTASLGGNLGSSRFGRGVLGGLLRVAGAAAPLRVRRDALLPLVGAWLAGVPTALVQPGGDLHASAAAWVQGCLAPPLPTTTGASVNRRELARGLTELVTGYVTAGPGGSSSSGGGSWVAGSEGTRAAAEGEASRALAALTLLLASPLPGAAGGSSESLGEEELRRCYEGMERVLGGLYSRHALVARGGGDGGGKLANTRQPLHCPASSTPLTLPPIAGPTSPQPPPPAASCC